MKAQTKKGTKVTFEINDDAKAEITIPGVKTFEKGSLRINDGVVVVGRMKGQKVGLGFDSENQDKVQLFIDNFSQVQEEKKVEDYKHLEDQLPEIDIENGTYVPESKKVYDGPESDGLNLAVNAQKKADKNCKHEIKVTYRRTHKADGRKMIERIVECKKCGLVQKDTASENVSETARNR